MRRREFIAGLGSAAAWPMAARAQQADRVRRIGVLVGYDENDPEGKLRVSAFTQALADLGWTVGRNVRMDLRWGGGDNNRVGALAQELVGLQPDIIVATATPATIAYSICHRRTASGGAHAGPATRCCQGQNRERSRAGVRNFFATAR
jgi:putative ABC transport system substrate-binding protein